MVWLLYRYTSGRPLAGEYPTSGSPLDRPVAPSVLRAEELAEHHPEDAEVAEGVELRGAIDANPGSKGRRGAALAPDLDVDLLAGNELREATDRERFPPGETERRARLSMEELERQDAHADEVAPVDPLEALGDHRADAEEHRPLRGQVARAHRAVLLAGEHDQRSALGPVPLGGVEDRHPLVVREVGRPRPLGARGELVAQPHVRERAAHHHLVVAAARAVAVELRLRNAVLDQVPAGR